MRLLRTSCATARLSLSAAALVTPFAFAQAPAPDAAASAQPQVEATEVVEEVVVRGQRMREVEFDLRSYVREFIGQIAAPPAGRGYARWHRRVCIGVHNVENDAGQYIVDRVSELAADVGLKPGEPGCAPEVIIVFATNADETAAFMVEQEPRLFRPGAGLGGIDLGRAALEAFAQSDQAVRWWHVSVPVDARTGQIAVRFSQFPSDDAPVVNVAGPSRIHSGIRDDMVHAIIIVDSAKLTGTTWEQLADYLAVVSLAQIDPKADASAFDSILNLFSNPAAYSGLTDWDRSYLRALYSFSQERTPHMQTADLVSRMTRRESERDE